MNLKDYVEKLNNYLEENPEHANLDVVTSVGEFEDVFYCSTVPPSVVYIDECLSDRYGGEYCETVEDAEEYGFEKIVEVIYV